MKIALQRDNEPDERRVALTPANVPTLQKMGFEVVVEREAGVQAGFNDETFESAGATLVSREQTWQSDVVVRVRMAGASLNALEDDCRQARAGQILIGTCDPLGAPDSIAKLSVSKATVMALELIPRITRAQSMDVLSSQATIAGYRAVMLAATELPRMFPMMMTAAGTLRAAKVFVIGAGVAGLQAIATAKRLGGVVSAYDVRPACREQVESLGGKFVELEIEAGQSEDQGGYAKQLDDDFYRRQRELMTSFVSQSDVVITTAAIPGKPSPMLVPADAVRQMRSGGVIIDLASERGGNCELTRCNERVVESGVTILGPVNLPSEIPDHASQMFGNNVTKFLGNMVKDGQIEWTADDEIIRETTITRDGVITNDRIQSLLAKP